MYITIYMQIRNQSTMLWINNNKQDRNRSNANETLVEKIIEKGAKYGRISDKKYKEKEKNNKEKFFKIKLAKIDEAK